MQKPDKIFSLGLSRTATTSLHVALLALGFSAVHYPGQHALQWLQGKYGPSTTEGFDAFSDIPTPIFFRRFHQEYPNAKFIYTRRDPDKWLDSVEQHMSQTPPASQFTILRDYIRLSVYGTLTFDRARFMDVFLEHEERVEQYFSNYKDQFLKIDIDSGELEWQNLSTFLNTENPQNETNFPRMKTPNLGHFQAVPHSRIESVQSEILGQLRSNAS